MRLFTWLGRGLLLAFCLVLLLETGFLIAVASLNLRDPDNTAFMQAEFDRLSRQSKSPVVMRQTWVPYDQISVHLKRAVIAAEDSAFVQHEGVDWKAIEKAMAENQRRGQVKRGGSTITQQLAKNLFLSGDRSYLRKGQELLITYMLEATLSKRRIFEIYLNVAEWGEGVFGIEAAAQHHYGVPARALTPQQSAWLASILPAPRRYERLRDAAFLQQQTQVILVRMNQVAIPR